MRRVFYIAAGIVAAAVVVTGAAVLSIGHADLGSFAARRIAAATGREVRIGSLHIHPGLWLTADLDDLHIANIPGGSRPDMISAAHLHTEVRLMSLLHGPTELRNLELKNFSGLFERTADRTPNWRFGKGKPQPQKKPASPEPEDQSWFPGLRNAKITGSEVIYRTSRGHSYRAGLDNVTIASADDRSPLTITIAGAYNKSPVTATVTVQSTDILREAGKAAATNVKAASGDLTLTLDGTVSDLLNFDGVNGQLHLATPTSRPLLSIAGSPSDTFSLPLRLDGHFLHHGDVWSLDHTTGALGSGAITAADVVFTEGAAGKPDSISGSMAFGRLNVNELSGPAQKSGGQQSSSDIDIPLLVPAHPDPLIDVKLSAKDVLYNRLDFSDAVLAITQAPGKVTVHDLSFGWLGAKLKTSGTIQATVGGAALAADVRMDGADIDRFRRQAGLHAIPVTGRMNFRATAKARDVRTLNQAVQAADLVAAVGMDSGTISREIIDMASTDVSLLIRHESGSAPVSCLLGVLSLHKGQGTVVPLRIVSAAGSITGAATFDLSRKWFDLAFQSRAPGLLALEIPIRVSGPFGNPGLGMAGWSATGRALLKNARDVSTLPAEIGNFSTGQACLRPVR